MEGFKLQISGWEDGQRVEQELEVTDRWALHAADEVRLRVGSDIQLRIKQQPKALGAARMGVGACVWEGELLLAAYLASLPRHRFVGARCVELGCGPGLAGLTLARLGATVLLTDKACVLPLVHDNVQLNGLSLEQQRGAASGWCEVQELEWGTPACNAQAAVLAADGVDLVVAADCVYIDNEGASPSTEHFVRCCAILCQGVRKDATCLVAFELRSQHVKDVFLGEAVRAFTCVRRIPQAALPKGCQVEHIELYELKL